MDKVVRKREGEPTDPTALGPDQMRLYGYYKPALFAGNYTITATQTVSSASNWGHQDITVKNVLVDGAKETEAPQVFEVMVPRFSLDPEILNSFYPPDGHQDEGRILPHIVFNDPHYPWEILAGKADFLEGPIDPDPRLNTEIDGQPLKRNLVPWVALVVFDPEELHFESIDELLKLKVTGFNTADDLKLQDPKGIFKMKVSDYFQLDPSSLVNYDEDDAAFAEVKSTPGNVDIIFPEKQLVKDIFGGSTTLSFPPPANSVPGSAPTTKVMSTIEAQKYLAHVRHINTIGFPDAGVEEEGLFSIVVSSRTGKLNITQPHTQVCHLVSIEHLHSTMNSWSESSNNAVPGRLGMVSLFSWIYTALPPNPVNFVDTVRHLVTNQQMLAVDRALIGKVDTTTPVSSVVTQRLKEGYTLARWRTQSGEETAAFNRGPLVPGPVPYPVAKDIVDCSNTSQDYQILDPATGLMDLSYSSAWQIGKTLAISDTSFSSALMRFRSLVHNSSVHETQMAVSSMQTKGTSIRQMQRLVGNLQKMSAGKTGEPDRFRPPTKRAFAPALQDPELKPLLQANVQSAVTFNASAGEEIYNEFNLDKGNNSDWAIVHSWLCEKLCLGGIPPQYLLPEPAYLPPESLRFFHIDDFWLDCFIDGALSVANHLDSDDDVTRRQIKETFNVYLENIVPRAGYKPQIPCYGFLIRSQLIKAMPDLRITVTWQPVLDASGKVVNDDRASVCRWTKWDDETLMALVDRQPEELESVVLAQPPHQQRFSLGSYVRKADPTDPSKPNLVEFDLRKLYTSEDHPDEWPEKLLDPKYKPNSWLNFDTRVLQVASMAQDLNNAGQFSDGTQFYTDPIPNSCVLGLQLNDPSYYFKIDPPTTIKPTVDTQRKRSLYVRHTEKLSVLDATTKVMKALSSRPPPNHPKASPLAATEKSAKAQVTPAIPSHPRPRAPTSTPTPLPIQKPPNSQTRIQLVPRSRLSANFRSTNSGPLTLTSKFQLAVFADYKPPPRRFSSDQYDVNDYIPTRNQYFYDLVFAITKTAPSDQTLFRLDIDIPLLTDPANAREEALLESNYYGPGLRMLANQRFVPFLYYAESGTPGMRADTLHVELVPRATNDGFSIVLDDGKTNDLSFRLAEAPVSALKVLTNVNVGGQQQTRGKVTVWMTEWYRTAATPQAPGEPVRSSYVLVKRAVVDDKGL